jgi:hypothetical protein
VHHFDPLSFLGGSAFLSVAAYAAQHFPMPANKYGKWALGVLQFALANKNLGQQNFAAAAVDQKRDDVADAKLEAQIAVEKLQQVKEKP